MAKIQRIQIMGTTLEEIALEIAEALGGTAEASGNYYNISVKGYPAINIYNLGTDGYCRAYAGITHPNYGYESIYTSSIGARNGYMFWIKSDDEKALAIGFSNVLKTEGSEPNINFSFWVDYECKNIDGSASSVVMWGVRKAYISSSLAPNTYKESNGYDTVTNSSIITYAPFVDSAMGRYRSTKVFMLIAYTSGTYIVTSNNKNYLMNGYTIMDLS